LIQGHKKASRQVGGEKLKMEANVGLTLPDLSNRTWAARDDRQNLSVESKAIKMVKCRSNADVRMCG